MSYCWIDIETEIDQNKYIITFKILTILNCIHIVLRTDNDLMNHSKSDWGNWISK